MMIAALLICCSLLRRARQTPLVLMRSENLTRPEPQISGGSRAVHIDTRLPWYTSGFE